MDNENRESADDSISREEESIEEVKIKSEEAVTHPETESEKPGETVVPAAKTNRLRHAWTAYKSRKKIFVPLTVLAFLLLLMAVPMTRYGILGLFMKKDVIIYTIDSRSGANVFPGITIDGKAPHCGHRAPYPNCFARVPVGRHKLKIIAPFYDPVEKTITVGLGKSKEQNIEIPLVANGRQLSVLVRNSISQQPVPNVHVKSGESETVTNLEGWANLVVDPVLTTVELEIFQDGYNTVKTTADVSPAQNSTNVFVVPKGKIHFLSKLSGKIDVVRTDLDGGNRQTVLAGTGREIEYNTVLLASRDWKYLALQARREGEKEKLYLIDTQNDNKLTTMDEGDASFSLIGWYNEHFVFQVNRNKEVWQDKRAALKSFNASSGKLTTIDETAGQGSNYYDAVYESYGNIYILENLLVYPKNWSTHYAFPYRLDGKQHTIYSVRPDGSDKKTLKAFAARTDGQYSAIEARLYEPQEVYFQIQGTSPIAFYEYEDGAIKEAKDATSETFNRYYPTYLVSPSGKQTFWFEERDGKNVLFLGNNNGEDKNQIASLSEFTPYGWFSDDYLLVSKKGSELYIMPAKTLEDPSTVLKVTDYHKPSRSFSGYGYGYGGF